MTRLVFVLISCAIDLCSNTPRSLFRCDLIWGCYRLVSSTKVIENQWVSDDEPEAPEKASQFPKQAQLSPDYVPGPEHPPSPDYVPSPEYPEYLVPYDDEEDPEEDPTNFPADKGGDEEEVSEEDEEEHLTPITVAATTVLIATVATALPSSSPPLSPLNLPSSPLPQIPSPPLPLPSPPLPLPAPSSPLLLPSTNYRDDILEADLPPQKRLCLTTPTPRDSTNHLGDHRVIELATTVSQDTYDMYVPFKDAQDDRALLIDGVNMTHIQTQDARIRLPETLVATLMAQTLSLQAQLTAALGRINTLEARELARFDDPKDADSSA
nr:hypothetical protein [Tanacetum cinerariifolium]